MKLREYLDQERGRLASLSKAIDAYPSDVSRWADEIRPIPISYGAAIEIATGGAVTRQEMFPNEWQKVWPELSGAVLQAPERRTGKDRRKT